MDPQQWARVEEVLDGALDLPPEERADYVARTCADDPELRAEVEGLLAEVESQDGLLDSPPPFVARDLLEDPPLARAELEAGTILGHYRVVDLIGTGGMGAVYLAERADGTFEKQVALKVIQRGVTTEDTLRRFNEERRILARLEHPNIAGILDGGVTPDGRPYLVMDLALGDPIDLSCDQRHLDVEHRLELFRTVADAVQYAHRNLVVHRDLKPSNIVVGPDGTVRLLDFGIAKALDEDETEEESEGGPDTLEPSPRLTPEYAAPEQVRGEPTTAATDVYALGVVLYELLTGARPYEIENRSMAGVTRAVCDTDVPAPSALVGRRADPDAASLRGATSSSLKTRLQGDLDAILLKALEKDPDARYDSVAEFSNDVLRHLEGRPVRARPATRLYRTMKFVRRYRLQVAAVSTAVLALLGGVIGTTLQWRAAEAERAQRLIEAERASLARSFLVNMLSDLGPEIRGSSPIRPVEIVDRGRTRLAELETTPALKASVTNTLGQVSLSLSQFEQADSLFRESLDLLDPEQGASPLARAEAMTGLGYRHIRGRDSIQLGAEWFQAALELRRAELPPTDTLVLESMADLGFGLYVSQRYDESLALLDTAVAGLPPGGLRAKALEFRTNTLAAQAIRATRDGDSATAAALAADAEASARAAIADVEQGTAAERARLSTILVSLVQVLMETGQLPQAEEVAREAVASSQAVYGDEGQVPGLTWYWLADVLRLQGRLPEAEEAFRRSMAAYRAGAAEWERRAVLGLSSALIEQGKFADAAGELERFADGPPFDGFQRSRILPALERVYRQAGREGEADRVRALLQPEPESQ